MKSPVISTETNCCWSRPDRPAACVLMLAMMALFASLGIAQPTNPPTQTVTNQGPTKPDSHVETPTTYDVDLTGGRGKPKPTALPASNGKQAPDGILGDPSQVSPRKSAAPLDFYHIRDQADALRFPPAQLGPDHAGLRVYIRYTYILTNMESQLRGGKTIHHERAVQPRV